MIKIFLFVNIYSTKKKRRTQGYYWSYW